VWRISRELWTLLRFSLVGGGATFLHLAVASWLVVVWGALPIQANAGGFMVAFLFSFLGQHFWAFRSQRRVASSLPRFLMVAGLAFLASNLVLLALLALAIPPLLATLIAACVIPLVSFILFRWWVF